MYKVCYFYHESKSLCYFDCWKDAHEVTYMLKRKYPDSKIWMEEIKVHQDQEHFKCDFNDSIPDYERNRRMKEGLGI